LRIWSKKDDLVYDREFDAVDRYKSWEVTDRVEWIQVNDRKGKVLVNVITEDEVRSQKKPPNESPSNHRTELCQITEQNHVKSPNAIDSRLQEVIKYAA